jgi:cyclic pyranopterin phosphate synthase
MSKRPDGLTHLDADGRPQMVDVTAKDDSRRTAVAEGRIVMKPETLKRIMEGRTEKGDPVQLAQLAGVMGGKKTADLIPLCHALPGASIEVELEPDLDLPGFQARASSKYMGKTGVEMEALTAVSIALLTVYDMVKAIDRGMYIEGIKLISKKGGASGAWSSQ